MSRRAAAVAVAALALAAAGSPAAAQSGGGAPSLEAVEAAADEGRIDEARRLLARWREEQGGADEPRSLLLAARLTADADSARRLYARLAVEGDPDVAPRARLRLAQLRLADGRPDRALTDLRLLRADFPGSPLGGESWLWTGHARRLAGDAAGACEAYRTAADGSSDPAIRDRAAALLDRCGDGDEGTSGPAWSVQIGAFRDPAAAASLAAKAGEAGYGGRVLPPGEEGLRRVRVGRWGARADAEEAARRLSGMGFSVIVVDARDEEESGSDR